MYEANEAPFPFWGAETKTKGGRDPLAVQNSSVVIYSIDNEEEVMNKYRYVKDIDLKGKIKTVIAPNCCSLSSIKVYDVKFNENGKLKKNNLIYEDKNILPNSAYILYADYSCGMPNTIVQIKNTYGNYYNIDIYLKDKTKTSLTGYLDTGNHLTDPYKNRPIILVNKDKINFNYDNILLVPYDTLNNHGLLKCIIPDKIFIDTVGVKTNFLIGLSEEKINIEGVDCILHSSLMERTIL